MSPAVKGTSGADALCIEGVGGRGGAKSAALPGTAVSAHAGCGGSVALFLPPQTLNARRLRPSAAIYTTPDQRPVLRFQHCTVAVRGEEQRPETAVAEHNTGWNTVRWLDVLFKKNQQDCKKQGKKS